MSRFFDPRYSGLAPYVPGEQPRDVDYIKLNTTESPFPPSPRAVAAAAEAAGRLQLYSDPEALALRREFARIFGLEADGTPGKPFLPEGIAHAGLDGLAVRGKEIHIEI